MKTFSGGPKASVSCYDVREGVAIAALRYFYEDYPALHVVSAGSLLEVVMADFSFPVGRIQLEWMCPMSFFEFIKSVVGRKPADNLPNLSIPIDIDKFLHGKIVDSLRYYFIVGGMPEAVAVFKETKLNNNLDIQNVSGIMFETWCYYRLAGDIWIYREDPLQGHLLLTEAIKGEFSIMELSS